MSQPSEVAAKSPRIEFRPIGFQEVEAYIGRVTSACRNDIDSDVRFLTLDMFRNHVVEGIYVNGLLGGFARWSTHNGHLSNLLVSPEYRNLGIGAKFLNERPIRQLHVMPENKRAISFYQRQGFSIREVIPHRFVMARTA